MWEMHPHFSLKLHYHLTFFLIYVFYFISLSLSSLSLSLSLSVSLTLSFSCMCLCRPVKGIRYFIARVTRDCELSHRDAGNWTWPLCDISAHLPSACTPSIYSIYLYLAVWTAKTRGFWKNELEFTLNSFLFHVLIDKSF